MAERAEEIATALYKPQHVRPVALDDDACRGKPTRWWRLLVGTLSGYCRPISMEIQGCASRET
jgi:hypothetical protein